MINPVFGREVRTAFRSLKSFILIAVFSLVLSVAIAISLWFVKGTMYPYSGFSPANSIGIFVFMAVSQLIIIMLFVPALCSNAISGERERQTFDLLLTTKMSTFSIIFGKFLSAVIMVVLMIISALPVVCILSFFGNITLGDLLVLILFQLSVAAWAGMLSIFFSSIFKRSITAVIVTYVVEIGVVLITIVAYMFLSLILATDTTSDNSTLGYVLFMFNPIVAFFSLMAEQFKLSSIGQLQFSMSVPFLESLEMSGIWWATFAVNIVVSGILMFISSRIIIPTKKPKKGK